MELKEIGKYGPDPGENISAFIAALQALAIHMWRKHGTVSTYIYRYSAESGPFEVIDPPNTKSEVPDMLGSLIRKKDTKACAFMGECWYAGFKPAPGQTIDDAPPPRNSPDRKEAIMLTVHLPNRRRIDFVLPIENKKVDEDGWLLISDSGYTGDDGPTVVPLNMGKLGHPSDDVLRKEGDK